MRSVDRQPAGLPIGGQFAPQFRDDAAVVLPAPQPPACPPGLDPAWFDRLEPHQQRDLAQTGTVTLRDAGGDPVEVRPGILDGEADWVFKNGQCLGLAAALARRVPGSRIHCERLDLGDTDAEGAPFPTLAHAYLELPDGTLLDIAGDHDPEAVAEERGEEHREPVVFADPDAALAHFDGYLEHQDETVAESFAARVLAQHRLGPSGTDYDALSPAEARALLDTDLVTRYTRGDCGVLAHHLAERNGWGVCMVGSYDVDDSFPEETLYTVDELWHAYAVRPDGMLVDVRGVHHPDIALDGDPRRVHRYPDAASADRIWDHTQWYDTDWFDSYECADPRELAAHTAALVARAHG